MEPVIKTSPSKFQVSAVPGQQAGAGLGSAGTCFPPKGGHLDSFGMEVSGYQASCFMKSQAQTDTPV